jgi:hypothetical protein
LSSDPRNSPGGIEEQRDDDIPRPKRGKRKWTEAQDTCLREMCTPGSPYSTAMMAARIYTDFGRRVSRFAVWGRVMRLGLSLPLPADQARPERPLPHGRYRPRPNRVEPLPAYRSRTAILDDPGGPGVLLLNASDGDCRIPWHQLLRGVREAGVQPGGQASAGGGLRHAGQVLLRAPPVGRDVANATRGRGGVSYPAPLAALRAGRLAPTKTTT